MERIKSVRGFWWLAVLVAIMLPTSGETRTKKLYQAPIHVGTTQVGNSVIGETVGSFDYIARTFAHPDQVVTQVTLVPGGGGWQVTLCENNGVADCTYNASGNLDISGPISAQMLMDGGASGSAFVTALRNGNLYILLNGGSHGSGVYIRII